MQWNDPGALYSLLDKENTPRFPFSIDQEGDIYVTQPLDREEKDAVSKTKRRFTGDKTRSCAHGDLRAERILLNTRTTTTKPPELCSEPQCLIALKDMENNPTNLIHFIFSHFPVLNELKIRG